MALAAGATVALATPASAAPGDPEVNITDLSPGSIRTGETATLKYTVKHTGATAANVRIDMTSSAPEITIRRNGTNCGQSCFFTESFMTDQSKNYELQLVAGTGQPGATKNVNIQIKATVQEGSNPSDTKSQSITWRGPDQSSQSVKEVGGTVKDIDTGTPVGKAIVGMVDGAGKQHNTQADDLGKWRFTATEQNQIVPGTLTVGATKDPYTLETKQVSARAGEVITVNFALKSKLAATPTVPPVSTEAAPTEASVDASQAVGDTVPISGEGGGGTLSFLLIGMGGLLVVLGIGAIVLLLVRRRDDGGEDEDGVPARPGPTPRPAATGVYRGGPDPTMVPRAAAIGDRTMVTRPAISDATAMHRPTDPYGQPGGYGAAPNYPGSPAPGYAGGGYPPAPPQAGYGAPPQAYGSPQGYGPGPTSPAHGYGPPAPASPGYGPPAPASPAYGQPPQAYGPGGAAAPGYGPTANQPGYGHQAGAYDPQGYDEYGAQPAGYGQASGGHDGYGAGEHNGGYDPSGGSYDQRGYDQRGYDQRGDDRVPEQRPAPEYEQGGYDGYYDDGAGQSRAPRRGDRRVDWLDD